MYKITGMLIALAAMVLMGCGPCADPVEPCKEPAAKAGGTCGEICLHSVEKYLPGPDKNCSTVWVKKTAPEQVQVGQAFDYQIKVRNLTKATLHEVKVWDEVPNGMVIVSADPGITRMDQGWAVWDVGQMKAEQTQTINVRAKAVRVASLKPCAEVTYRMEQVCLAINVVQPALHITKTAPSEKLQCDTIPVKITVKNDGSGPACNVVVSDPLPQGLTTLDGKKVLKYNVGRLEAGQSKTFTEQLRASKTGAFTNTAVAEADGDLRAQSTPVTTVVTKPDLDVNIACPEMRYTGRPIKYDVLVANGPEATAEETTLTVTLSGQASATEASHGGSVNGKTITWNLGTMKPRTNKKLTFHAKAGSPGKVTAMARVNASCGKADDDCTTEIEGIPALLLEVIDLDDPIEVDNMVTYEITVTNQGSKADTGIQIASQLPSQLQFVDAAGPTQAKTSGQKVTFGKLPSLAPKAKATWRITAKVTGTGDVRFATELTSDQLTSPANETEPTRLYK